MSVSIARTSRRDSSTTSPTQQVRVREQPSGQRYASRSSTGSLRSNRPTSDPIGGGGGRRQSILGDAVISSDASTPFADVSIDTRPLWRILLERTYRPTILLLGVLAYVAIRWMPAPAGLSESGQKAVAVFAICLVYWVSTALPLMVTSLLAMVL